MLETSKQEIKLFYCYAREDKALRDELEKYLSSLKRLYSLHNWHDREILPGEEWEHAIDTHLNTAHLILLLVSPDFMNSEYCYGKEMQRALERHEEGTCKVIPIILRPTYLEAAPFNKLQMLPTDKVAHFVKTQKPVQIRATFLLCLLLFLVAVAIEPRCAGVRCDEIGEFRYCS